MTTLNDLDWNKDKTIQDEAIKYFSEDKSVDFNSLIKKASKKSLSNLIEIISHKKLEEQYKSIDGLLYMLQDLSWPGSDKALSLLKKIPKEVLLPHLEKSLNEAYKEIDDNWIANLRVLINFYSLTKKDFKTIDLLEVLSKAAW